MHKAPFVWNFSKVHMEKLNHPCHLNDVNDVHYSVVVFFSSQLMIYLPVFGEGRKGRWKRVSGRGRGESSWFICANFPIFLRDL